MLKRILSLMLCIAMVFAMCTITFAVEETADAPVADVPATEAPATEAPATEAPVAEAPATEAPATEAPATEAPVAEAPATEAPATEAPATEAPATEAPATEAPATEAPATEAPATEAPATEAPATEAPATEAPATEAPATEEPVAGEPIKLVVTDSDFPVQVNGVDVSFEDVGLKKVTIAQGDITLAPLRKIAEMLNCTVAWRASDRTVHIFKNGKSVVLTIDNPVIKIYDFEVGAKFVYTSEAEEKYVYADNKSVTPVIEEDRTFVPLRAISECLNTTVKFDEATGLITIDDNDASMVNYKPTIADIKARNLIETYNYKPAVELKSGSVTVNVSGNFEGATSEIGNGVTITINGQSQTTANGGTCTFAEVKSGTYKVEVTNIPEGYALQDAETTVTVEGGAVTVNIYLVKAVVA